MEPILHLPVDQSTSHLASLASGQGWRAGPGVRRPAGRLVSIIEVWPVAKLYTRSNMNRSTKNLITKEGNPKHKASMLGSNHLGNS
jgi:hypothetical protein